MNPPNQWLNFDPALQLSGSADEVYAFQHLTEGRVIDEKTMTRTPPVTVVYMRPGYAFDVPDPEGRVYAALQKLFPSQKVLPAKAR